MISAIPTQYLRGVVERFEDRSLPGMVPVVSATKGLEMETLKRPSEILAEVLGERPFCVLSGPSHAEEVARLKPASVVAASADEGFALRSAGPAQHRPLPRLHQRRPGRRRARAAR